VGRRLGRLNRNGHRDPQTGSIVDRHKRAAKLFDQTRHETGAKAFAF
jgi:hypothetical protein